MNNNKYELYKGDCLEVLKSIKDKSIDLVVIDPPYLINYQSGRRKNKYNKILNDGKKDENFIDDYLKECHRVLKDDTAIYCFCSWHNIDIFKNKFEKYFKLKNILIWEKNNHTMGDLKGAYASKYEMILFGHKGRRLLEGARHSDILQFKKTKNENHPTEKPTDLLELLISNSSKEGDVVLDIFMGSGSTGVACANTNRRFIGVELEEVYFNTANDRIKKAYT